jgi:hypothetical protein
VVAGEFAQRIALRENVVAHGQLGVGSVGPA